MCNDRPEEQTRAKPLLKRVLPSVYSFLYQIAAILFLPIIFCWFYYFTTICTRYRPFTMLKDVTLLGLIATWISMPLLLIITLIIRKLVLKGMRFSFIFCIACVLGYLWLIAWNLTVMPLFNYFEAFFPICFSCALGIFPAFLKRYWISEKRA